MSNIQPNRNIFCIKKYFDQDIDKQYFKNTIIKREDQDSSVGIATRYGLDGPGIESLWGRDFPHLSRLSVGPIQSPIQRETGLPRG